MTRETFTDLVLDSEPTLYRVAMSMLRNEKDCEDAVQTAILTAYEKLGTLKHEEYFKTWLVRILINVCNKQLKSASKTTELNDTDLSSGNAEVSSEIRIAIESLPVKIRQVIDRKNPRRHCQKPPEQRQSIVKGLFKGLTTPPVVFTAGGVIISGLSLTNRDKRPSFGGYFLVFLKQTTHINLLCLCFFECRRVLSVWRKTY